jgi:hypothetical protein
MDLKCSHHIKDSPRSCKAAKLALLSSEHGSTKAANLASMALIHASASRGSSALVNVGAFILRNWVYVVTWFGPSWLAPCRGLWFNYWAIFYCVCWIWRSTSVWVAISAFDGIMGDGGGSSPLPDAPKPLGELRVGPTIWKCELLLDTYS